ncbi:MAG TPA: hypothetical protein VFY14_09340 [Streptomyces sp.]|nr:hypothetical protein [Streptomyces sp.]
MDRHEHTPAELAALELYHQLANLSPDNGDRALLITLRMPNGRYVGDVWLSTQDVQDLADAGVGLAAVREYQDTAPVELADDPTNVAAGIDALERLANGGDL